MSVYEPHSLSLGQLLNLPPVTGPSSTLAWPRNDATAYKLDPSVAMSSHSSMSPQFGIGSSSSQPTPGPAQYLKKESTACLALHNPKESAQPSSRSSSKGGTSNLPCPFCSEVDIQALFGRKHDLKRHLKDFHRNTELWNCPVGDCGVMLDWKSALKPHLKKTHPHAQNASKTPKVKLLPQLVFACGFSNCKTVFEVRGDDDPKKIANKFFEHVADTVDKRCKDNLPPLDWKYSVRFRNLMRQEAVDRCWKERTKGHPELVWQPHSSFVLRKILETRYFSDTPLLVQWAIELGSLLASSPISSTPELPSGLALPVDDDFCTESSGRGPQCPSDAQPDSPMDHPAPPATGPIDLGEPSTQLSPASPQHDTAFQDPGTAVPRPGTFGFTYHSFEEAGFFQNQSYPEHSHAYHDSSHGLPTSLPTRQQTSQYPPSPLDTNIPTPGYHDFLVIDPRLLTPYPSIPPAISGEMEMQDAPQREYGCSA